MPHTVRITRGAQSLDTTQLEQFAREQLRAVLGEAASEWTLENPPAPAAIPSGAVSFRLEGEPRVASQSATLEVVALVENQPRARFLLRFKAPAKPRQIAVRSGESVQVRVVADGVVLEVKGVARATTARATPATGATRVRSRCSPRPTTARLPCLSWLRLPTAQRSPQRRACACVYLTPTTTKCRR